MDGATGRLIWSPWRLDVVCVRREIHARSTHPQVPVKRHRGRRDTRTRITQTNLTTIPHNHPDPHPHTSTTARRPTSQEPTEPRSGRTHRHKPPHTTHPKKTGGSRVTSTGKKTGGSRDTHTIQARESARKPNRLSYLQEIFRRSVKLPKTPINSNAQDANAVASLRLGSSIGLEAS